MFEKIMQLKKEGALDAFVQAGLLSPKVYTYIEIYMYVNAKLTVNPRLKKTHVVKDCAVLMGLTDDSVWRALRCMNTIITKPLLNDK